jgi:excisionase family DNA binding protein
VSIPLLLHLPEPVGWVALTPDGLREAQIAAQEILGSDTNTSIDTTSSAAPTALLTAEAAAEALSVDPHWLLRQAREGRIPHVRLGRYVRFDPAAIAAYCARAPRPPATATSATPSAIGRRTRGGGNRVDS